MFIVLDFVLIGSLVVSIVWSGGVCVVVVVLWCVMNVLFWNVMCGCMVMLLFSVVICVILVFEIVL